MKAVFHLITTINRGGAENQLLILVREQIRQGFKVHVVFLKGEPELGSDFEKAGALVHSELAHISPLFQPVKFRKIIKGSDAIVHAHLPRAELVALLTFSKFKFFASRHNSEPFFPGAPKILSNLLSRLVEIRSEKIIAISNAVNDFLVKSGEVSNQNNIEVIRYGYRLQCEGALKKNGNEGSILKLGTISRLTHQKDLPTMLLTFKEYKTKYPGSSLTILGAGPLESELKQFAKTLGLSASVQFLGRSSQIFDFLGKLDAFILTSKYEGFGMVLLEAMDAGVPIIASDNSAIPEVLGNDFPGLCTTGDYLDFAEKITRLNDTEYRDSVLRKQEYQLKIFDAESMAAKILEIYVSSTHG